MQPINPYPYVKVIISFIILAFCITGTSYSINSGNNTSFLLQDTSSLEPNIFINASQNPLIAPAQLDINFTFQGFEKYKYLRVISDRDGYNKLKLGYDKHTFYNNIFDVNYEYIDIVLKDLTGTADWSKIAFRPNGVDTAELILGEYISEAEVLEDGWLKVRIKLNEWGQERSEFSQLKYMEFPYSKKANNFDLGIREIYFVGDDNVFEWLGPNKNDNIHNGDGTGKKLLAFKVYEKGVRVGKIKVMDIGKDVMKEKVQMPFFFPFTLPSGKHQLVAIVTDTSGNEYLSDTLLLSVSKGITFVTRDVTCHGASDGQIEVTIDGGKPPYSFLWSNGATTKDMAGLAAGVYSLTVRDDEGTEFSETTKIGQPGALFAKMGKASNCEDSIKIEVFGGNGPYTYQLDNEIERSFGDEEIKDKLRHAVDNLDINRFDDIVSDGSGNVYLSGTLSSVLNLSGSTVGVENESGLFIVKINPVNELLWSVFFKENNLTYPQGGSLQLTVDDEDNLFAAISNNKEVSADLGEVQITLAGASSHLFKFNTDGGYLWHKSTLKAFELGIDAKSNIYLASNQNEDIVIKKITNEGTEIWTKIMGGPKQDKVTDMVVDHNGDIFLTGSFYSKASFGEQSLISDGQSDIFVLKMNENGIVEWAKHGGGNYEDRGEAITLNKAGELIVSILCISPTSSFEEVTFNKRHMSLLSLNADQGSVNWANTFSTWQIAYAFTGVDDIITDNDNNIYISGEAFEPIKTGLVYNIKPDLYLLKCDALGNGLFLNDLNTSFYRFNNSMPLSAQRNGVMNATYLTTSDYQSYLMINEYSPGSEKMIYLPADATSLTIRDNNACFKEYSLSDSAGLPTPKICYATVAPAGGILINWSASAGDVQEIYRETNRLGEYDLIGTSGAGEESFTDTDADPLARSYSYKLKTIQSCAGESDFSAPHKTMHLTVNEGNKGQINLIWDGYEGFDYKSFQIYRGATPEDMEFLAEVPSNLFTYTDYDASPSTLYYQISVETDGVCDSNKSTTNGKTAEGDRVVQSNIANKFGQLGGLSLYPNPASDMINIRFNPDGNSYNLSMIDMKGRVVISQEGLFDRGTIYTQSLPQGLYTIIVTDEKGSRLRGNVVIR